MSNVSQRPMITTVIPTYRRPKLLRRAIQSVLNQTYPNFQVCVYDNASGDETAEVVAEFTQKDPRVKYYCHRENIGATKNFIYGAEHVETPFFSFLSDDDILLPEFYQTALEGFERYPEAFFSATATIVVDNQGNIVDIPALAWKTGFYQPPEGLFAILKYPHLTWTGILFRREVIEKISIVIPGTEWVSDTYFELHIAARLPFVVSQTPGAIFLIGPSYHSKLRRLRIMWWSDQFAMIRNLTEDESILSDVRRVLTEYAKRMLLSIGVQSIIWEKFDNAYKVAEMLRNHYHLKIKAFFLSHAAKVSKHFPPFRCFIGFLYAIRKHLQRKNFRHLQRKHLQKEFGHYVRFLEI